MENLTENSPEYHQIGPFKVHRTTLMSITGWKPNYWTFLPLDVREGIDNAVIEQFHNTLENYSGYDVSENDEAYLQWFVHRAASAARNRHWYMCLDARAERENQIQLSKRVNCGARKKNGQQCRAKAEPGRNRCRFHGGKSTGPKTIEGKIKSLSGLPQYRRNPALLAAKRQELIAEMKHSTGF